MERALYLFYILFQGILLFQSLVFFYFYFTTRKKELLFYAAFLFLIGVNFLISDPGTFGLGDDDAVLNSEWYKLINTPLVISANIFYVLFLRGFYKHLTQNKLFFSILNVVEKGLLAVLLIFLILFAAGIHSNFLFNIVNLIGTLTGIWLVSIIIKEKMPFTRLMARGFIFNLAGTLLSVFMLMLLAKGVKHLLVSDFPFVFVKLGILAELFYFNMAIFLKWHWQEKELALQQLQTALEVERVKTRISAELHDDVGSMLSGISMYSHMAIQQAGMKDELAVRDSLQTIQQSSDEMVNRLKDMVWFNKQGAGSVTAMVERLKEYAAMMCRAKGIELKMEITSALNGLNLPEEIVYNIYLVGKEAVNNAVKYSGATELVIRTSISKGQLALAVSDNGKGFNPEAGYAGNGINNMKKRAEETGGQLSI